MKKIIALALVLMMIILIGCNKTPTPEENDTALNSGTNEITEEIIEPITEEPTTEPLSYDDFFSKVRPYEIKMCEENKNIYPEDWTKNGIRIGDCFTVGARINQYSDYNEGPYTSTPYKCNDEFREDRLYIINDAKKEIVSFFSDLSVYHLFNEDKNGYDYFNYEVYPFSCRKEGVYAVVNHNELALLDFEGKMVKSIYTAAGTIKHFYVLDTTAWVFSEGTIYRIYLPTGDVDKICDGIDTKKFQMFYYPISNYEIQWAERYDGEDGFCSKYYNAKTGESKTKREITGLNEADMRGTATNTGWWFVPEDSYERIDDLVCSLPEEYDRSEITAMGLDPQFSCGGGVAIWKYTERVNASEKVGWISINYDFKPVFEGGRLVDVDNIPSSRYRIYKVNPIEDNSNVVITIGDFDPWWADEYKNYRFAFACKGENEPVYALILRSDVCTAEEFEKIVKTIQIEK